MHTSTNKANINHQKALDVVAEFLAKGGKIKKLDVTIGGKSKSLTSYGSNKRG